MWRILNAENKILKYVQILAARKNQADWEIPAFTENQADWEILALAKNQADWEILAFAKNQADWEILAFTENQADLRNPCVYRKTGGFEKSLRLQKNRRTIESLQALKSPRLVKNPRLKKNHRNWKSRRPAYCLGSAESPAADFFLVWLMSSRSIVPAACTGPPCQEMAQIHAATKSQASAWNSTNSCQITKFLTRLISVLSLSRKNVYMITVAVQYQLSYSRPPN